MKLSFFAILSMLLLWTGCNPSSSGNGGTNVKEVSVTDVLKQVRGRCAEDLGKFNHYALVLEDDATIYNQKVLVAGSAKARVETRVARKQDGKETPVGDQNIYEMWDRAACAALADSALTRIAKNTTLDKPEKVDGADTYVLAMTQSSVGTMGSMAFAGMPKTAKIEMVRVFVDQKHGFIRQIRSNITEKIKNKDKTATVTSIWRDYRDIKGLMIPFETVLLMEGEGIGLSDADKAQITKELEANKQMIAQLPTKEQQEQAKKMIERNEKQLAKTSANRVEQGLKLLDAKVNEPLPPGLF
ncbi:MAG: hypothetical protein JNN12_16455 [Bacteroidetes Order II. Incertae sedis bacterium]|nr:hypothetical protein [Bacteroidetes Order II. bacterium]